MAEKGSQQGKQIVLDADQRRVVDHVHGPLRVLGGPGTGKTVALEERFVDLAGRDGCSPDRILFLVPNRTQKIELEQRLTHRLLDAERTALIAVPVYTWHGFANHLVSRHYDRLAYQEPPVLLTSPEQWGDIKEALAAESEANWPHHKHLLTNRGFVDEVVDFCIRAEQRMLEPADLDALVEQRPDWAEVVRFFKTHQDRLRNRSRVDYPTLLSDAVELIAQHDDVRAAVHKRFIHVLVDDAQELPFVQQRLLQFLAGPAYLGAERSLVVAGDPDSSIETFRGAEPDWLQKFEGDFGEHESVTLNTSYRLGPQLGERSNAFISFNGVAEHRSAAFQGATVLEGHRFTNLAAELEAVGRAFRLAHLKDGIPYEEMAILLTSVRAMLPTLERSLNAVEVPFSLSAPDRPLEREPVVRTFADLARFSYSEQQDPEEIAALLRSPLVGLGDRQVRELERDALAEGRSLAELLEHLPADVDHEISERVGKLFELRKLLVGSANRQADESFSTVWQQADYYRELERRARKSLADPANRELDALVAFSRALGRFVERRRGNATLREYLDAIGRADFGSDPWLPPERNRGGVQVLSFHAAKGKEWELVAVCGCIEGAIPKGRRARGLFDPYLLDEASSVERARRNEAEDRRVFYVAVTRAKRRCIVTTSPGPTRKGQPSRFVEELLGEIPPLEGRDEMPPLTFAEAATRYRRTLVDQSAPPGKRVAALAAIGRTCELDPECSAARPAEWWWRWDWTEGAISLRAQQTHIELPLDKLQTSYSRISVYDDCGLKYLLGVVLGLDPETSHNMAFGTWMHKIFEECETGKITNRDSAMERYHQLFDETVFPNKPIARQFLRDGEVMIDRYIDQLRPGTAVLAERSFSVDLDGHLVTGRIDRVDAFGKNVVISDYKTSRYAISWEEAAESLQLAIYYLAGQKDPDIAALGIPSGMKLIYPAKLTRGKVTERVQQPEQAEAALERLPVLFGKVLAEDFRPNPEADCTFCRFKPLCPLWTEGKELPP